MTDTFEKARALRHRMFPEIRFSYDMNNRLMAKLLEECGELAGSTSAYFGRRYRPELETGNVDDIKGEIGDVLNVILGVCELWGTTPEECMELVMAKLERRLEECKTHST